MFTRYKKIYDINDPEFFIQNCQDGRKVAYILATGNMIQCFMYSGPIENNNVRKHNTRRIWEENELFLQVRKEKPIECTDCANWYSGGNATCNNVCWVLMYMATGSLNKLCGEYVKERILGM